VQQLNAVLRQTLIRLAERAPLLAAGLGGDLVVFLATLVAEGLTVEPSFQAPMRASAM
jgi:hypothetical protein